MASEAARQKYPDGTFVCTCAQRIARQAYDAGRVDALREAAAEFRSGQITGIFYGRDDYTKAWLQEHADRIEKEARG